MREGHFAEEADGFREAALVVNRRPGIASRTLAISSLSTESKASRHLAAVRELGAVIEPPLHLRAADLGGRRIFHEIVDGHRAPPAQPGFDVLNADADVLGAFSVRSLECISII